MKECALVIVKPDGISKGLVGHIITKFFQTDLEIIATKILKASKELAEEHYKHIKGKPFYNEVIEYLLGNYHNQQRVMVFVYSGRNAIRKCRDLAGDTNPEMAIPTSIRGSLGRITAKGAFENVIHVSSDISEAEREIKLWFNPGEIDAKLYPTKEIAVSGYRKKVWLDKNRK